MAKKKSNLKTKKTVSKSAEKQKTIKKASKKTINSQKKTNSKSVKSSSKVKKTSKALKNVKKKAIPKKKKELQKVKPKAKDEKKVIKKPKAKVEKKPKTKLEKKPKKIVSFDDHIKDIITKLLDKHKVDGIYTSKIIEKAIPKKFRIPENVLKVEGFLNNSNITIVSEKEAAALNKAAKEESSKKDEDSSEEEKKQTGKTPLEHAIAYAERVNPEKKQETCISSIERTRSEFCTVVKKQISLTNTELARKPSEVMQKFPKIDKIKKTSLIEKIAKKSVIYNRR